MDIAITMIIVAIAGCIIALYMKDQKQGHETFWMILSATSVACFGIVGMWLLIGIPTGQYPMFSLAPLVVVGSIAGLMAFRAYNVYRRNYETPDSQ